MKYHFTGNSSHPAAAFAAEELLRALELLHAPEMSVKLFAGDEELDGFTVDMNFPAGKGFIKGSNPRSLLFGVYRLMNMLGFSWLRPGKDGEVIPPPPEKWQYLRSWEQASTKLRAVCIEGADSRENLLDMVDWMTKHFMNTYYLQSESVHNYLDRYYRHLGNPMLKPEPLSRETSDAVTAELTAEIIKRGLILYQFGHGPTTGINGFPERNWNPEIHKLTDEKLSTLAMINGERALWHNEPGYTQLCYSNPVIQHKLADYLLEKLQQNPQVQMVNFWLSDHHHNFCECSNCRTMRPADWYVKILNIVDEKLSAAGIRTRIGFAVYYDLLWPPVKEKFNNPERFFMVACPVTRSYSTALGADGCGKNIPPYLQNISPYPQNGRDSLAFFNAWREAVNVDSVVFDYHYMWDLHKDYSGYALAEVIHRDVCDLEELGFCGFISCQNQRAFFPNSLGMIAMAAGLWNSRENFETVAEKYFKDAFGENNSVAQQYFRKIKDFFPVRILRGEGSEKDRQNAIELLGSTIVSDTINDVIPAINSGLKNPDPARRRSWEILKLHTEQLYLAAQAFMTLWKKGSANAEISQLFNWARSHELDLQNVFDVYEYISTSITVTGVDRNTFMNSTNSDLAEL